MIFGVNASAPTDWPDTATMRWRHLEAHSATMAAGHPRVSVGPSQVPVRVWPKPGAGYTPAVGLRRPARWLSPEAYPP